MPSYQTLLRNFLAEIELHEKFKCDMILKMAQQLEKEGHPVNEINNTIANDCESKVTKQWVGQVLKDTKYKDVSKIHKKKKEPVIELAVDGSVIDPMAEVTRINEEEHKEFPEALDKVAEEGSKQIQSLDQVVLKELDQVRDERNSLQIRLNDAMNELQKLKQTREDLFEYIEENLGYYMVFARNEDNEIFVEMIDSAMAHTRKELKIDLRKFEDNIKDSYKKGKHVAEIKHNGTNVTSWK